VSPPDDVDDGPDDEVLTPEVVDDGPDDVDDGPDDEVLTPEVVDGGPPPPEAASGTGRPDRRPVIGMLCGFGSLIFLVLIPVPLIMLTLAIAGVYLGRQVLRDIARDDIERARDRKRAKAGLVAGLTTLLLFVVLIIVLYVTFEPPDKGARDLGDDKATSEPAG